MRNKKAKRRASNRIARIHPYSCTSGLPGRDLSFLATPQFDPDQGGLHTD
jgi:hypothetical protein